MTLKQLLVTLFLQLLQMMSVLAQTPVTLNVVEKTSYPFSTPGNTQEFELAGTGTDGATTLVDRIRVSEYLVFDDTHSTPFLSTATAASTYTQTFIAVGSSAYEIIYVPEETGAVAVSQSCVFGGQDKGQCVEEDWVVGQSSTQTTTFTGPAVPY
ncbi:hypothetical protein E1B28_006238 [Marasmius oreades]|uniref:Uncharacterized protein n=1 Tax=Marasmius oreades TaxID=181124 RepID=A0A9P7S4V2_9AGAR|nr:uncharacterized protein E1B28_006238 [Marasmius oreades]KAG7095499.1 hypothetical protein E1B28_006238 [Marasmius oreades]